MTRRHLVSLVGATCIALSAAQPANAEDSAAAWRWGLAAGFPQCLAVTLERVSDSPAGLQFHAGTVLVASSVGARFLIVRRHSVAPYAFFGGGVLHVAEGEGGGGTGATGYGWAGVGLRLGTGSLTWFGELGGMFGLDEGKGYDSAAPTLAVGVAFGR